MEGVSGLTSCSIGDNCHQLSHHKKQCIYNTTELDEEQAKIMKRIVGIEKLDTV